MLELAQTLLQPANLHALFAATLVAISGGFIAPFVLSRGMAFAVHGVSELAFTGAAAGLLVGDNPLLGALAGSLAVASVIGVLGARARERDSAIGVILAFGLGVGALLLSLRHGFAGQATNILFGNILAVSNHQLGLLVGVAVVVIVGLVTIYRPLQFASVDPVVAEARGVPVRLVGIGFLLLLALAVTEAAQVVGTLLVLSMTITPAAAAVRWSARPAVVTLITMILALVAADGGLIISFALHSTLPSMFVAFLSFGFYLVSLLAARPHLR